MVEQENGGRTTDVTEYRKGLRVRTDSSSPGIASASMIQDVGTGRTIMLWHDSKTATEHDFYETPALRGSGGVSAPPSVDHTNFPDACDRRIDLHGLSGQVLVFDAVHENDGTGDRCHGRVDLPRKGRTTKR